jgi:hypothetical protein
MKKLFLLACIVVLLSSCQKEEPKPSDSTPKANYFPLKIGNYWVYDLYQVDPLGNETLSNRIDSVIVKRDTIIRNTQYYVLENFREHSPRYTFLRDSSGYVVDEKGIICFSAINFTDILAFKEEYRNDGILLYTLTYKMEKVDNPVILPAGRFDDVLNFKGTAIIPQSDGNSITKEINNLYTNNIGKIFETIQYLSADFWHERRLVRYYVQ